LSSSARTATAPDVAHAPCAASGAAPAPALLRCEGVSKAFGGISALSDVSFAVPDGAMVGLIGPNGAGKTTLFNCISGFASPDAGAVLFDGRPIDGRGPQAIAREGIVRTFQTIRMFPGLTVYESLLAAQCARYRAGVVAGVLRLPRHRREMAAMRDDALDMMGLLGLAEHADAVCERLPLLAQRKVELARAALARPRLLLLDEPSAGATPAESEDLAEVVRRLHDDGITILLIEHDVPFVAGLVSAVHVLNFGELIASGPPDAVLGDDVVAEIYLGRAS
jgi:ABC-type branched-subunit amino acid transport system ATPase component